MYRHRTATVLVVAAVVLLQGPGALAGADKSIPSVQRIAGDNRFQTAVAVSQNSFAQSDNVVLAPGGSRSLMVVGSALAARLGVPLLLTASHDLPEGLPQEIRRLGTISATLIGSSADIAETVSRQLADLGVTTVRLGGSTVFETAALASDAVSSRRTAPVYLVPTTDDDVLWQGGMVGGMLAAAAGGRLLLTRPTALPEATERQLTDAMPAQVIAIGTPEELSGDVTRRVQQHRIPVRRLTEPTAGQLAVVAAAEYGPASPSTIYVAGSTSFVDGLLGVPAAATAGAVILLADPSNGASTTAAVDFIRRVQPDRLVILGGRSAISQQMTALLTGAAGGVPRSTVAPLPRTRSAGGDVVLLAVGAVLGLVSLWRRRWRDGQRLDQESTQ